MRAFSPLEAPRRPNPRMQPPGRIGPGLRPGASSLEDEAERRFVRAPAREPAADAHFVRRRQQASSLVRFRKLPDLPSPTQMRHCPHTTCRNIQRNANYLAIYPCVLNAGTFSTAPGCGANRGDLVSAKANLKRALSAIDDAATALRRARSTDDDDAATQIRRALSELDDAETKIKRAMRELPDE